MEIPSTIEQQLEIARIARHAFEQAFNIPCGCPVKEQADGTK